VASDITVKYERRAADVYVFRVAPVILFPHLHDELGVMTHSAVGWWRSLYWRIGVSFVLLVIGIALIQGLLFAYQWRTVSRDPHLSPHGVVQDLAREYSAALERGRRVDIKRVQRERYPDWPLLYAVMSDGTVSGAPEAPMPPEQVIFARQFLPSPPGTPPQSDVGPMVTAPIHANGQLRGVVVLMFEQRGLLREASRFLSWSGLLLLLGGSVIAAWFVVTPARRKLSALEAAAEAMREGDLQARACETGGDEVARVARAFNRMGEQLAERDDALKRVDELRRQMLADVSHELKTPLTAMRGFIETLQMPDIAADEARRTRYFATLERETRRLERLVADLLDVARLESGAGDFEMRVFATRRVLDQVARRNEPVATEAGVSIDVAVDDAADQVYGDPHRLEQAVDNLVANALRYTPRGGAVRMGARLVADDVILTVSDTGPGIAPEHMPHVFDRFYKVDPSRAATRQGSGLGLSIVRAIIERHGGSATVTSVPGETVFTLRLPAGDGA
jgi:two-component system sensor histidine kinase BaeS